MGLPLPAATTCCAAALAMASSEGVAAECQTCGTIHWPSRPSAVDLRPRPALGPIIEAVSLVLALEGENDVSPRPGLSPIARAQGRTALPTADASEGTTARLWRLISEPAGRVGERRRKQFLDALVDYCAATSADTAEPDWVLARRYAEQLARVDVTSRRALVAVARRCRPAVSWDAAALVVADECAPRDLRERWTMTRSSSRAAPPVDLEALAWGEDLLTAATAEWSLRGLTAE